MAKNFQTPINLNGLELLNARLQNLANAPGSPTPGTAYYDTTLGYARIYSAGSSWVNLTPQVAGYTDEQAQDAVAALIAAGTHAGIAVTYDDPNNTLSFTIPAGALTTAMHADGSITNVKVASGISADKLVDGTTNGAYLLTERSKLAGISAGATANSTDAQLRDRSTHTGTQSADSITDGTTNKAYTAAEKTKLAGVSNDAVAGTASQRTLGTGAQQAAAGNDSRLSDTRTPTAGSVVDASVASGAAIAESKLALASDAAAGTASRRTLGTGALQAAAGNDARLSDTRTPTDGSVTNAKVASGAAISADKLADGTTNVVMLATERSKLAGVAAGATNYTDTNARANRLDQFAVPTSALNINGQLLSSVASPVSGTDAANKNYVDAARSGLDVKDSVRAATVGNITLSGTQTIDTVAVVAGDRVLVKNQTTASANGIYIVSASGWTRSTDTDTSAKVTAGMATYVEEGTNGGTRWVLTTPNPITLGTTSLSFTIDTSANAISAGAGLASSAGSFNVGQGTGITVSADSIAIDTSLVPRKYAQAIGDGTTTNHTVTHNLGSRDLTIQVYTNGGSYDDVEVDIQRTSVNAINIIFASAPAANAYRVVISG